MTARLYEEDAYLTRCRARVVSVTDLGDFSAVQLDQTVFYALGGGQPGDRGVLRRSDGSELAVVDCRKNDTGGIHHVLAEQSMLPEPGEYLEAEIDWPRRHRHMRMHTCLHLLCALVDAPVTGGSLGEERGRLDFDLPEPSVNKIELTEALNRMIQDNKATRVHWIEEAELDARPELVKTLSVAPPRGTGRIRLLEIPDVDLQPCGGTHVRQLAEIGRVRVSKIEKKSRMNRRISIVFDD